MVKYFNNKKSGTCIHLQNETLISKAKSLAKYATLIDNDGFEYIYQDVLKFIKNIELEENRELSIGELKDIAFEINFYSL